MAYYIESKSRPVNTMTFETIEDVLEFARAPKYPGAPAAEITMLSDRKYKDRGQIFEIYEGENPTEARRERRAMQVQNTRSAFNANGTFRGSNWLSREMDRSDSDF